MNRLDARARLVFHYAREEADRLGHAVIESEHLLLGLLREGGTAAQVLNSAGLSLEAARHRVVELIGRFERSRDAPPPAITALARRVMDLAGVEAGRYQSSFITTGHVLLGMIHAGDGVAMGLINQVPGGTKAVRRATLEALQLPPDDDQQAEQSMSSNLSGIVAVPADSVLAKLLGRPPENSTATSVSNLSSEFPDVVIANPANEAAKETSKPEEAAIPVHLEEAALPVHLEPIPAIPKPAPAISELQPVIAQSVEPVIAQSVEPVIAQSVPVPAIPESVPAPVKPEAVLEPVNFEPIPEVPSSEIFETKQQQPITQVSTLTIKDAIQPPETNPSEEEIPDSMLIDVAFDEVPPEEEHFSTQIQANPEPNSTLESHEELIQVANAISLEPTSHEIIESVAVAAPLEPITAVAAPLEPITAVAAPLEPMADLNTSQHNLLATLDNLVLDETELQTTAPEVVQSVANLPNPAPESVFPIANPQILEPAQDVTNPELPPEKVTAEVLITEVAIMPESDLIEAASMYEAHEAGSVDDLLVSDLEDETLNQVELASVLAQEVTSLESAEVTSLESAEVTSLESAEVPPLENSGFALFKTPEIQVEPEIPQPQTPQLLEPALAEPISETLKVSKPPTPPEEIKEPLAITTLASEEPRTLHSGTVEATTPNLSQIQKELGQLPSEPQKPVFKAPSWDVVTASSVMKRHIIALGGGGFSQEPDNLLLDQYILEVARTAREVAVPRVCFVSTACGDDRGYTERFYTAFRTLNCEPTHLPLFHTEDWVDELEDMILSADVLYFSGGSTKNAMALWSAWELEPVFQKAYEAGTVFTGISAGAICWFEQFTSDSIGRSLGVMNGLGWLPGSFTPHYDSEKFRKVILEKSLRAQKISPGFAADDGAALHFVNAEYIGAVASRPHAKAYHVTLGRNRLVESPLETTYLGS